VLEDGGAVPGYKVVSRSGGETISEVYGLACFLRDTYGISFDQFITTMTVGKTALVALVKNQCRGKGKTLKVVEEELNGALAGFSTPNRPVVYLRRATEEDDETLKLN
jgi:hypothetical protein